MLEKSWKRGFPLNGQQKSCLATLCCKTSWKVKLRVLSPTLKLVLQQASWVNECKCFNGLAPPYLCQKFKTRSQVHNCNTRNRDRPHIPLSGTAAGQRAFTFRGQKLWISLPDEFQSINNLDVFKGKIKQFILRVFLEN